MPDIYHHGVLVTEVNTGTRTIRTVSTAIIGLVATAADAVAATFPLNTPVLITDVATAIADAGTSGTLRQALQGIADQASPVAVVVRVEEGVGEDAAATTTSNVIGTDTDGRKTGLQALLAAQAQLGVKPRIIGAPGLDNQAVATALVTVAQKLRAMAYAYAWDCADVSEVVLYRENFGARELMLIWPEFVAWDTTANAAIAVSAVARALGLRARIDQEQGWHKTLSNVAVNGVTGISKDVSFDLQNPNSDAGVLNAADVTTLVNMNGYRFWGSRTCSDDALFAFESATRSGQIIADTIAEGVATFVDKPLHPSIVKDIVESINAKLRSLVNQGYLIGASCWYDEANNPVTGLSAGQLKIDYDYTPVPPIEQLGLNQRITDSYFADFAARVTGSTG
ncbi:phage tail sheath subtilisin-like domain-containing protein [Stenotrophomonas sp. MMGLT7]|uniref:phage tail sheath subtilisin-like domain-containing protein n=1 Tax=Stenotrophomonas sp. MMGLT7 TaxID=2901227 RepID=UPI001E4B1C10|nr:phage tail sheath subtilisin-like domain-containing protein [Stenotrophomonas sp. MMGLT7]MCD7096979.1 phage tail sheath subtilisin-like domain-containing protein [Stenotrophomonas sp. MMGLT7]